MGKLAALLFDVDGTLADTERDGHRVAFNRAFADAGLDWEWSEGLYGELLAVTGGKERIRHYVGRFHQGFSPPGGCLDHFVAGLHAAKNRHYLRLLEEGAVPLREGIERLLRQARAEGIRLAIATTTSHENVTALLRHTLGPEAESWFEVIGAGDVVAAKKPASDIYEYVLARMRLSPGDCIAIEDSANGVRAARGAGLCTVITVNDYTRDDDFDGAALILDSVGEPARPFSVLAGDVRGATWLDTRVLESLIAG
ncbi:MAG TPA: HAD family hydrolase [Gammaproteobacteria bacterium]|nr:HAD family hydrolase [Gammaproteobacteria bacterium]